MAYDFLRNLSRRLANIVSRAVVRRVDDSTSVQTVQVTALSEETRAGIERFQEYGFTSVPLAGAEGVVLFVGGFRDHGLMVATDDRSARLTDLEPGEVAIYTDQGDKVVIERGGTIRVTASTKVVVDAPLVELAGNTEAAIKGTSLRSADATLSAAHTTFLGALTAYITAIQPIADPSGAALVTLSGAITAFTTAIATYESAAAAALSTKVKLS